MALFEGRSLLWRWLADQPPYVEVGIGMFFVLIIGPSVLAVVAISLSHAERVVEKWWGGRNLVRLHTSNGHGRHELTD